MYYKQKQVYGRRFKRRMGTPIGYKHRWHYGGGTWLETKGRNNTWKFRYSSPKRRSGSSYGGPPVGYKVMWKINAIQIANKTSGRSYNTNMYGYKKLMAYYDPRARRWAKARSFKRYARRYN